MPSVLKTFFGNFLFLTNSWDHPCPIEPNFNGLWQTKQKLLPTCRQFPLPPISCHKIHPTVRARPKKAKNFFSCTSKMAGKWSTAFASSSRQKSRKTVINLVRFNLSRRRTVRQVHLHQLPGGHPGNPGPLRRLRRL